MSTPRATLADQRRSRTSAFLSGNWRIPRGLNSVVHRILHPQLYPLISGSEHHPGSDSGTERLMHALDQPLRCFS
jgi:hypothetical protein